MRPWVGLAAMWQYIGLIQNLCLCCHRVNYFTIVRAMISLFPTSFCPSAQTLCFPMPSPRVGNPLSFFLLALLSLTTFAAPASNGNVVDSGSPVLSATAPDGSSNKVGVYKSASVESALKSAVLCDVENLSTKRISGLVL